MITEVRFKNFKALRDTRVPLSRFTLIVGPNASGKTSILEGMHYLSQLGRKRPEELFCGKRHPAQLRTSGVAEPMTLQLTGEWGRGPGELRLTLENATDDVWGLRIHVEWPGQRLNMDTRFGRGSRVKGHPLLQEVESAVLFHFDPARLAEPSFSNAITPRVEFDGGNLAATLADMAITSPDDYQELLERLQTVVPSVKSLRLHKTPIEGQEYEQTKEHGEVLYRVLKTKSAGYRVTLDFVTGGEISATQASEGTLLTLGLLTALGAPSRPRLVLVDELERGLHPKALGELVKNVREIQRQFPELQVVGTTHSPYLVDHFEPAEIILTALREDGSVAVGPLNKHPEFDRWKDEMKPGEFWSTVGEDWLRESKATEPST